MSDWLEVDRDLAERRADIDVDEELLRSEVAACCAGTHHPVQHRDRKPPWCRVCGRDARGERQATPPPPGVAAGASPGGPVEYRSKDDPDRCTSTNRDGMGGQIIRCVLHHEHVALREEHTSAQGRTWPVAVRETPISDAAGAGGGES